MALTRPKIWDIDTNVEWFVDPITVLHQASTQANVDVGFLFNRANGLVSNVALYWNESSQSFVTAFTSSDGTTNTNIAVTSYANITTGNIVVSAISVSGVDFTTNVVSLQSQIAGANAAIVTANTAMKAYVDAANTIQSGRISTLQGQVYTNANVAAYLPSYGGNLTVGNLAVTGNITTINYETVLYTETANVLTANVLTVSGNTTSGNVLATGFFYANGTPFTSSSYGNVQMLANLAAGSNPVTFGGNIVAASGTTSTSTSTGALVVTGGVGISGNLYVGGNISAANFLGNVFFGPTPTTTYYTQAPLNLTNSLAGGIKTQLNLINTGGGAGAGAGIDFYTYTSVAGSTYPESRIAAVDDGNYSSYITFQTKIPGNTGANALAERLKIDSAGNIVIPTTTTSTSTTTGALVVTGGAGIAGNVFAGNVLATGFFYANGAPFVSSNYGNVQMLANLASAGNLVVGSSIYANTAGTTTTVANLVTANGVFWPNGSPYSSGGSGSGIIYTASNTVPSSPHVGDQWYYQATDTLYEYINDGTQNVWVDIQSSPTSAGVGSAVTGNLTVNGNLTVTANTYLANTTVAGTQTVTTLVTTGNATVRGNLFVTSNAAAGTVTRVEYNIPHPFMLMGAS